MATYPDDDDDDNEDGGPPIDRPGLRLLIEHATAARFFDLPPTALPRPNMSPSLRMSASAILRSFREEPSKSQAVANAQAAPEEKDTTK
ncbi:hypothetical protein [Antarcticirhabdus aurantiaca]|uniref:Uncharacterized protein n=1 Tax=Antarcticirhabdus aurantiaca TaxID=2606717 RepID=A0ACD4NNV6_9HYPH|nr:hypothetical protein [Antarcticirhabdus aurantiaca]WAJ28447.1 hypothetical protein OXU80_27175 [Jeongeuplla avenae]